MKKAFDKIKLCDGIFSIKHNRIGSIESIKYNGIYNQDNVLSATARFSNDEIIEFDGNGIEKGSKDNKQTVFLVGSINPHTKKKYKIWDRVCRKFLNSNTFKIMKPSLITPEWNDELFSFNENRYVFLECEDDVTEKEIQCGELKFLKLAKRKHPVNGHELEYLKRGKSVACLLVDESEENCYLVKQYRPGCDREIWEIPAGMVDEADKFERDAMFREIREETGFEKEDLDFISLKELYPTPGISSGKMTIFFMKVKANAKQHELILDEHEILTGEWKPMKDILKEFRPGDMKTVFAITKFLMDKK